MEQLQVKEEQIKVLTVTVLKATGVDVGGFFGRMDIPDPYVKLRVRTSPNSKQQTKAIADNVDPEWNETFTFYLNSEKKNILELKLRDEDIISDDHVGKVQFVELDELPLNKRIYRKLRFNKKTSLEIKLMVQYDATKELRFSYDLCEEEKAFLKKRKAFILEKMANIFGENQMPVNTDEVPTIAVMGSGGGYRALCGLSGVFCALQEAGIFDCASYVTGLSGSSWYISTLYSTDGWPVVKCEDVAQELKRRFNTSLSSHFHFHFKNKLREKRRTGQPVRLTDFFGLAIGDALLQNQESRLSHQSHKVQDGGVPLPICTGIRVCKDVSAQEFSEWIEFSPFEFGMAKYGIFGKTADFGGKFYKGCLVKKFDEYPLHYLQGVWGSAFSILLSRLFNDDDASEENSEAELEKEVLAAKERNKTEDDDSDDEDLSEDEIEDHNWVADMLNPVNAYWSRKGKAAETFNFCRGLFFKGEKEKDFDDIAGKAKTMCIVDSGIAFNSPYPTLVRPERKVDLILSFDFSQRDGGDTELPFSVLVKAEKWANENKIPFPPVKSNPVIHDNNIRECYVFENPDDPRCPTILHFPLVNKTFRGYLKPGVPRVTQKDKDFANFDIFDDPDKPYSSFKFHYDDKRFDRLHELMKFNTLLNLDLIKEKIASGVEFRRNNPHIL